MLKTIVRPVLAALSLLALVSCTTTDVSTVSTKEFLQSPAVSESPKANVLAMGDTLEISVEVDGVMEVSRHRVGLNHLGYATLPLVGDVKVGGMTLENARAVISKTYGAYYVHPPVIMVSMTSAQSAGEWGYITVMGRVGKPGKIALPDADGLSLTEAIQQAGGFVASAKQSSIRITRLESNGKKVQVNVDFEAIGQGGDAKADINLIDGDIVYVPERIF